MSDLRIAIVSFEHMHAFSYAHSLRDLPGTKLVAASDSDAQRLARVRQEFPFVGACYADYRRMLDEVEIDAVIICSANADHKEIALECLRRGKHVMCEKPLATTAADAVEIIREARKNGVRLMTAFPVRFSPAIREAKRLIKSGALGRVIGACTSNHGSMPGGWFVDAAKSGGGAVMDHTVHVADLLRWLLEDEVETVYAEYATRLHDLKVDDLGQLALRFRGGTFVSLDTSWSRPKSYSTWGDVKLEIKGELGNVSVNCFPRAINQFDNTTMRHTTAATIENLDGLMIEEFVAAIREGRDPEVSGEDGLRAVEIALAAYEAGRQKGVVRVQLTAA